MEDLNPSGQTGKQPGTVHSTETLRTYFVLESLGAHRFAGDSTTTANRVGAREWSVTTIGDLMETLGATARATESSKAGAGATDIVLESRAQRPAVSKEQAARPEMS